MFSICVEYVATWRCYWFLYRERFIVFIWGDSSIEIRERGKKLMSKKSLAYRSNHNFNS